MAERPEYELRDLGIKAFPLQHCWFAVFENQDTIYRAGFGTKEKATAWGVKNNLIQM